MCILHICIDLGAVCKCAIYTFMDPNTALRHLLRPLARFAIARGLRYRDVAALLKNAFVDAAQDASAGPLTISRAAAITGLQRRDVASRLGQTPPPPKPNPLARVIASWPDHPLPRADAEDLIRGVSQDLHPRTILDELARLGLLTGTEPLTLTRRALIAPADDPTLLDYFARNGADHLMAAAENLAAAPAPAPHLDQAAHGDGLSPAALAELETLARTAAAEALPRLHARAEALRRTAPGPGRYRFGTYFFKDPAP